MHPRRENVGTYGGFVVHEFGIGARGRLVENRTG
jgi:hypothetical protein